MPPPPSDANDKVKSTSNSKGPPVNGLQKPVSSNGRPIHEEVKRSKDHRIFRYSPLGVPKPAQTARVQRMVERAHREFERAGQQSPYHHIKHTRPALQTPDHRQQVPLGYQAMDGMVRDGVPERPPSRLHGQAQHTQQMVGNTGSIRTRAPPPPQSRMKSSHDRIIDQEFNRDVSQCLVVHGGRALGLERSRCETSGLKALVEKNISSFETQSDAMKLCCLLVAKKLNQITENWVGSE